MTSHTDDELAKMETYAQYAAGDFSMGGGLDDYLKWGQISSVSELGEEVDSETDTDAASSETEKGGDSDEQESENSEEESDDGWGDPEDIARENAYMDTVIQAPVAGLEKRAAERLDTLSDSQKASMTFGTAAKDTQSPISQSTIDTSGADNVIENSKPASKDTHTATSQSTMDTSDADMHMKDTKDFKQASETAHTATSQSAMEKPGVDKEIQTPKLLPEKLAFSNITTIYSSGSGSPMDHSGANKPKSPPTRVYHPLAFSSFSSTHARFKASIRTPGANKPSTPCPTSSSTMPNSSSTMHASPTSSHTVSPGSYNGPKTATDAFYLHHTDPDFAKIFPNVNKAAYTKGKENKAADVVNDAKKRAAEILQNITNAKKRAAKMMIDIDVEREAQRMKASGEFAGVKEGEKNEEKGKAALETEAKTTMTKAKKRAAEILKDMDFERDVQRAKRLKQSSEFSASNSENKNAMDTNFPSPPPPMSVPTKTDMSKKKRRAEPIDADDEPCGKYVKLPDEVEKRAREDEEGDGDDEREATRKSQRTKIAGAFLGHRGSKRDGKMGGVDGAGGEKDGEVRKRVRRV